MSTSTIAPTRARPRLGRWAPLPVVLVGTFMVVLDFFVVNVALPSMQASLHTGSGGVEWVVAGYSLTAAVFLVAGGKLGDRRGHRLAFVVGLGLFTLASAACGLATSPSMLVAARLVQGVGAAVVMPAVLSLIAVIYTGADRTRALSAYAMTMGLAAATGQLIGGLLVQADIAGLGWRSVFLINLPIGAAALALAPRLLGKRAGVGAEGQGRLDLGGMALLTAGLTAIVLPLLEGRTHGWPLWTWLSLGVAPLLLAAFWSHQRALQARGEVGRTLVAPALLASRAMRGGLVAQVVFWCGQASFFLVLALYLQEGRGLSALDSGLVFTILALAYVATSTLAPALTERHGRRVLGGGALVLAAGHGLFVAAVADIGTRGSVWALVPGLLLVGAGMGLALPALATLILGAASSEHAGAVSGVLSTAQNVGNTLGVAVIGVLFFGAAGGGYGAAFELGEAVLAGLLVVVAALSRLLPAEVGS